MEQLELERFDLSKKQIINKIRNSETSFAHNTEAHKGQNLSIFYALTGLKFMRETLVSNADYCFLNGLLQKLNGTYYAISAI